MKRPMQRNAKTTLLSLSLLALLTISEGCGGKYLIRSYPAGAKTYTKDLQTKERKLVGISPVEIDEDTKLGDVFFVVLEKQGYRPKEVLVRVQEGESLTLSTRLDPMSPEELAEASQSEKKDDQKPQGGQPDKKKKEDKLKEEVDELKLRVALLENTVSFYKEAMFSSRFEGGGHAKFDRDRNDKVIENLFQAQQAIMKKNYDQAKSLIDSAIEMDEYLSKGWLLKGSLAFLQQDYQEAKRSWERVLKIDPHDKIAYTYLNKVYKRLGMAELPPPPAKLRYPASTLELEKVSP